MRITCPTCRFSRDVALEKIPAHAELATCPKCGRRFVFRDALSPSSDLTWPEESPSLSEETPGDAASHAGDIPEPIPGAGVEPLAVPEPQDEAPDESPDEPPDESEEPVEQEAEAPERTEPAQELAPKAEPEAEPKPAEAAEPEPAASEPAPEPEPAPAPKAQAADPAESAPSAAPEGDMWRRLEDLDFKRRKGPVAQRPPAQAPAKERFGAGLAAQDHGAPQPGQPPRQKRPVQEPRRAQQRPRAQEGAAADPPWEQLGRYGFFPGLFATMFRAMFRPKALFSGMSLTLSVKRPMTFYILMSVVEAMAMRFWATYLKTLQLEARGVEAFTFPLNSPWSLGWGLILLMIMVPFLAMARLFAWSFLHHLFLKIFQAAPRGFPATVRAVAYAKSAAVWSVIPLLGPILGMAWSLLITVSGCRHAHGVPYARVLCALGCLYVIVLAIAFLVAYSVYA